MFEQDYGERQAPHTEITLSNSALLLIFFALLAVCGVCFGFGYSIGKKHGKPTAVSAPAPADESAAVPKPAMQPAPKQVSAPAHSAPVATKAAPAPPPIAAVKPAPAPTAKAEAEQPSPPAVPAHGFGVQVAAIAQQADADALSAALRRKGFAAQNVRGADRLFHVQLGPFATQKEAAEQRDKLVDDGYMAVIRQQ